MDERYNEVTITMVNNLAFTDNIAAIDRDSEYLKCLVDEDLDRIIDATNPFPLPNDHYRDEIIPMIKFEVVQEVTRRPTPQPTLNPIDPDVVGGNANIKFNFFLDPQDEDPKTIQFSGFDFDADTFQHDIDGRTHNFRFTVKGDDNETTQTTGVPTVQPTEMLFDTTMDVLFGTSDLPTLEPTDMFFGTTGDPTTPSPLPTSEPTSSPTRAPSREPTTTTSTTTSTTTDQPTAPTA